MATSVQHQAWAALKAVFWPLLQANFWQCLHCSISEHSVIAEIIPVWARIKITLYTITFPFCLTSFFKTCYKSLKSQSLGLVEHAFYMPNVLPVTKSKASKASKHLVSWLEFNGVFNPIYVISSHLCSYNYHTNLNFPQHDCWVPQWLQFIFFLEF